jgi:hypothetical protein
MQATNNEELQSITDWLTQASDTEIHNAVNGFEALTDTKDSSLAVHPTSKTW